MPRDTQALPANDCVLRDLPKIKDDSYLKAYELYRKYVEHEDQLTNHRMTWANVIQGTILAAFGFIVHRIVYFREKYYGMIWNAQAKDSEAVKLEITAELHRHVSELMVNYNFFLFVVIIFGLVQSVISAPLIYLATRAIRSLKEEYKLTLAEIGTVPFPLPALTDGGRKAGDYWGYLIFTPPILFIIFWIISLFYIFTATYCLEQPLLPLPEPGASSVDDTPYIQRLACVANVPSRIWGTLVAR